MYLVFKCDITFPIQPVLSQLDKQNIVYHVVEANGKTELWVMDQKLVDPVLAFYKNYVNQYQNRLSIQNLKKTPVTSIILIVTFLTALITQLGGQWIEGFLIAEIQYYPRTWFFYEGVSNIWRFVSPIFLHFGVEHLIFNTLAFWYLGSIVERNIGRMVFIALILFVAVISNVSQLISDGPLFGGLSGVVYGLIGFTFLYQKLVRDLSVPKGLLIVSVIWMALGMTNVLASIGFGNMANAAHITGLLAGVFLFFTYKILMIKEKA